MALSAALVIARRGRLTWPEFAACCASLAVAGALAASPSTRERFDDALQGARDAIMPPLERALEATRAAKTGGGAGGAAPPPTADEEEVDVPVTNARARGDLRRVSFWLCVLKNADRATYDALLKK